jgi:hypothetical protein
MAKVDQISDEAKRTPNPTDATGVLQTLISAAQVHATLALAAVTARANAANMPALDANQWNQVA